MRRNKTVSARGLARASGRAFTLIEMMVGVGAVAIIAVGLAAIFDSVGKTVAGGRRVSTMNMYSNLIEAQMRRDFESMARDGFLIIRNQWVDRAAPLGLIDGNDTVPAFENQAAPDRGLRRIDEIQFGVNGRYETARQPLVPGVKATSNEAVVYYGHGEKAPDYPPGANGFSKPRPRVDDRLQANQHRLGQPDSDNEYPYEWTLLRYVTLLANPDATQYQPVPASTPPGTVFGLSPVNPAHVEILRNQRTQYFLQPAAASIFRSIASQYPDGSSGQSHDDPSLAMRASVGVLSPLETQPRRASGLVDIATGSFAEIRAMVTTCSIVPQLSEPAGYGVEPRPDRQFLAGPAATGGGDLPLMHAWLRDTMPTDSRNFDAANARGEFSLVPPPPAALIGHRIRYEPESIDLLNAITLQSTAPSPPQQAYDRATARADQLMLTSSNFIPHCTNFVVEWTYGLMDAAGNVQWFGLPSDNSALRARPYGIDSDPASSNFQGLYVVNVPSSTGPQPHAITSRLIYGVPESALQENTAELTAYFGYVDPTYAPPFATLPQPLLVSPTSTVLNWAWPKMIRVKVTLADPRDASLEQTFVYVFEVPTDLGRKIREAE